LLVSATPFAETSSYVISKTVFILPTKQTRLSYYRSHRVVRLSELTYASCIIIIVYLCNNTNVIEKSNCKFTMTCIMSSSSNRNPIKSTDSALREDNPNGRLTETWEAATLMTLNKAILPML
jgi:hypothetical protein